MLTRDRLVARTPIEITDWAQRNGELPKVIERPILEGKYWAAELVIEPDEPIMISGKRRYELIERGDEIWYAEVGDV